MLKMNKILKLFLILILVIILVVVSLEVLDYYSDKNYCEDIIIFDKNEKLYKLWPDSHIFSPTYDEAIKFCLNTIR